MITKGELPPLIMIGAGGHASVAIEVLRAVGAFQIIGCVDPHASGTVLGLPVLGGDNILPRLRAEGVKHLSLGLGSNRVRDRQASTLAALGFAFPAAISPSAWVSPSAFVDDGALVMPFAVVNTRAVIEPFAIVNTGAVVEHDCLIGRAAHIAPRSALAGEVRVGRRAFLGVGTSVRPRIIIGDDVQTGAGAAVICDLPNQGVYVGVPARLLEPIREV